MSWKICVVLEKSPDISCNPGDVEIGNEKERKDNLRTGVMNSKLISFRDWRIPESSFPCKELKVGALAALRDSYV